MLPTGTTFGFKICRKCNFVAFDLILHKLHKIATRDHQWNSPKISSTYLDIQNIQHTQALKTAIQNIQLI